MKAIPRLLILLALCAIGTQLKTEPVQIKVNHDEKTLRANADWRIPEGVDPAEAGAILWLHGTLQTYSMREPIKAQADRWVEAGYPVLSITLTHGVDNRLEPLGCASPHRHTMEQIMKEVGLGFDRFAQKAYIKEPQFQRYIQMRADSLEAKGIEVDIWGN